MSRVTTTTSIGQHYSNRSLFTVKAFKCIDFITVCGYNNNTMHTTLEAAQQLGLSDRHVRLLLAKGCLKGKKIGRDWVVLDLNYTRKRKPKGGNK